MTKMKRYSDYKDSGVMRIGEIPSHWEVIRLKSVASCNDNTLPQTTKEDKVIKYVEISDVDYVSGIKNFTLYSFKDAPSRARRITQLNDIIISTVRTYLKSISIVKKNDLIVSTGFAVIRARNNIYNRFLAYYLMSDEFINSVIENSIGVNYPAISTNKLLSLNLLLPNISEQHSIVSYLDSKVSMIDVYIAATEKKITALDELKKVIIADAVTHGINHDVKMKDSGIKWLGQMPEHWNKLRAKNMFYRVFRDTRDSDEVITCFRDGQVTLRKNRRTTGFTESLKEIGYQGIRKGDLVIHQMDAFAGSIGVSDSDGKGTPVYICCLPKGEYDVYYYTYILREMARTGFIKSLYRGIRERSSDFKFETFAIQLLPIPPIKEQQYIVSYIDKKVSEINRLKELEQSQIEKLKEYKQRLISDVVTGKVKVTD